MPLPSDKLHRPLVAIFADCGFSYGRAIVRAITRYANLQRRWLLFVDSHRTLELESEWPNFDAAIVVGAMGEVLERLRQQCRHVVCCSGAADPAVSPVVALDDRAVGAMAAEHLINCQFTHFAYYDDVHGRFPAAQERLAGYRAALQARGHDCHVCELHAPPAGQRVVRSHRAAVLAWLQQLPKPLGVFTFDDNWAAELAAICLEGDVSVPERVAIVGVNNDDLLCDTAWPPLSSVDGGFGRIGTAAAQMLDRMLSGHTPTGGERLTRIPPLRVVQRQSTDVTAVADPHVAAAIRYIREHACDPCTVHDVLRAVPVGRRWLERQFAEKLGRTPRDEIVRIRIDAAKRLLAESDLPMLDIASRCGFSDAKGFHQMFRAVENTTPATYRRRSRSPEPTVATRPEPAS